MYDWVVENKELLKIFYGIFISLTCLIIVLKSDKLFRLSMHKGIRYFRNAFFFYGIAFVMRYFFGTPLLKNYIIVNLGITKLLFEFFMIMAGFCLLYSLLWKKMEYGSDYHSSLLNSKIIIFYLMTFVIVTVDYIFTSYNFLFTSQIIIFIFLSVISCKNYLKKPNAIFPKFYFIAMMIGFVAWILNAIAGLFLHWDYTALIIIYLLNVLIFLLFLLGVVKITNKY